MRNSSQLIHDLIHLNADEWNSKLASELGGINLDLLKSTISVKELFTHSEDRIHATIKKGLLSKELEKTSKTADGVVDLDTNLNDIKPNNLTKYVVRMNEGKVISNALSCTGKYIVGMDFRNSDLAGSYFCDCIFFNCDFSDSNMDCLVVNGCIFNSCVLSNVNLTGSFIIKSTFIDSILNDSSISFGSISDTMFVGITGLCSNFSDVRVSGVGFVDCMFNQSDFKNIILVMSSIAMSEFSDVDFNGAGIIDCIFTDTDFSGSDFSECTISCVSSSRNRGNASFNVIVKSSDSSESPSKFEWDNRDVEPFMDDSDGGIHVK